MFPHRQIPARISGGEAFLPQNPAGMLPVCRRIAQDIRTRYTIGYLPQADHGKSKVRRIQVRVSAPDHKKLIARTRSSYRYEEENQEKE